MPYLQTNLFTKFLRNIFLVFAEYMFPVVWIQYFKRVVLRHILSVQTHAGLEKLHILPHQRFYFIYLRINKRKLFNRDIDG